ncbi:glycosyltransferase family 4 protein [Candidatus Uhrbacteria bacterium]|nr:glycosyltransferase family 4 protein [Candidatus Uhrbacteria bacterium]
MPNLNFAALSADLPLVLTVHDLSFEHYPSFFTAKERLWHHLVDPRTLVRRAAHLIAVSCHTKDDLISHYGIPNERVSVIYPGVADHFFQKPSFSEIQEVRDQYQLPSYFILSLASPGSPRKNIQTLIEAFLHLRKNPNFSHLHLALAGKKPPSLPLPPNIHFLGYVPAAHRSILYRLATVFVYPSFYEGFGLPPLEAMACGTPVVASHTASLGEVIGNAGLLINPYHINDLIGALEQILTDETLAKASSERGRERAAAFRWDRAARETLELFKKVYAHRH